MGCGTRRELLLRLLGTADNWPLPVVFDETQLGGIVRVGEGVCRWWKRREDALPLAQPPQIAARGKAARLRFGVGADDEHADAALRVREPLRGLEALAVCGHDLRAALIVDEMREREGTTEIGGENRALVARSEEPYLGAGLAH